jgi:radical SAM protein with 4Fe4S-binding SPASM domain
MLKRSYKNLPRGIRYRLEPLAIWFRRLRGEGLFKSAHLNRFPPIVQMETNSFCSGSCVFCPYRSVRGKTENSLMPDHVFKKIMDECSLYAVESVYLCLMNEPLTDKRIIDFINYAKLKNPGAKIKLITNAQFLSDNIARQLIDSRLDEIRFSVHGWTEDTYNKVMGMAFKKELDNMENFLKLAQGTAIKMGMVCIWTKYFKKGDYYLAYEFCKRHKIDFGLGEVCNMAENLDAASLAALGIKKIRRKKLRGCIDNWPLISIHIMHDGDVVACCIDWRKEIVLGNVRKDTLYNIWNGKPYQDFRGKVYKNRPSENNFICKRCSASI